MIAYDPSPSTLSQHQQEDLLNLGKLFLSLSTHNLNSINQISSSIDLLARYPRNYSKEFINAILYLLSKPGNGRKSMEEFLGLISPRVVDELAGALEWVLRLFGEDADS